MSEYQVGEVVRISNVSPRTLHHYDEIGLLVPSARSDAGYRLYSAQDLGRLRQILFYRELEFALDQIAEILSGPDRAEDHLRRQHRLLRERRARADVLLRAIENEMEARRMGISLTPEEQLEVFGNQPIADYAQEAEKRWGETDSFTESQRRTAAYSKDDWVAIKREGAENLTAFADVMKGGAPATSEPAMDAAEAHRQYVSRWFYECGSERHRGLAELYLSDPRFRKNYEEVAPGLTQYVHDAILANAQRTRSA